MQTHLFPGLAHCGVQVIGVPRFNMPTGKRHVARPGVPFPLRPLHHQQGPALRAVGHDQGDRGMAHLSLLGGPQRRGLGHGSAESIIHRRKHKPLIREKH